MRLPFWFTSILSCVALLGLAWSGFDIRHRVAQLARAQADPAHTPRALQENSMDEENQIIVDHSLLTAETKTVKCIKKQVIPPSVFILGWPHAGGRSLAHWMNMHSNLSYGKVADKKYWCLPNRDLAFPVRSNDYLNKFSSPCGTKHTFDFAPYAYQMANSSSFQCYFHGESGLKRFAMSISPESKFIVLLRDPVDRLNSMFYIFGLNKKSRPSFIDDLILQNDEPCYADLLQVWMKVFPEGKFLFLDSDVVYRNPQLALSQVFRFLGVQNREYTPAELAYTAKLHVLGQMEEAPMDVRLAYYQKGRADCRQRLEATTARKFKWLGTQDAPAIVDSRKQCRKILPPKVYYIGLEHAGSTKLAGMMTSHPDLSYGNGKEHYFWCGHPRTLDEYYKEFIVSCDIKITFDACPFYYNMALNTPKQKPKFCSLLGKEGLMTMKRMLSDDHKLIMMLRNPFDWMKSIRYGQVKDMPMKWGPWNACFADFLEVWLEVFPREKFLLLRSEDLFADAQPVFDEVTDFLNLPRHTFPPEVLKKKVNIHDKQTAVDGERERFLTTPEFLACQKRLENLTGMHFDWK